MIEPEVTLRVFYFGGSNMKEKKVFCYARVSTDMQQGGMESQIRVLKAYCEQNNLKSVEFYTDEGISGTKASRPALDRMMAAVDNDEASSVIVYSFSRFARSTTHLLNVFRFLRKREFTLFLYLKKLIRIPPSGWQFLRSWLQFLS
jgi:site-specific DNA recombinase